MNQHQASDAHPSSPDRNSAASSKKGFALAAGLCLVLVFLEDWFFYGHPVGWTLGGYGVALMAAIFLTGGRPRTRPAWILSVALAALFLWSLEEPGALMGVLGLVGLVTLALQTREGWSGSILVWLERWGVFLGLGWFSLLKEAVPPERPASSEGAAPHPRGRFLRNWIVPVIITLLFLVLFALANPIISTCLEDLGQAIADFSENLPAFERVLLWMFVAVWIWALLRMKTGVGKRPARGASSEGRNRNDFSPGFCVRCLSLFNLLFAIQTLLDVAYLWGGASLPEGMTYARYAHRGAYPLLTAAILAAVFVLMTFRAGRNSDAMRWPRRLVYAWLIQNVFLVFSAGWRLCLYVEVYTLTRWRIAAMIWMLLVGCGLVYILVRIVTGRPNLWLVHINILTAAAVLYACAFVDFDGFIAGYNVKRCEEIRGRGPAIDIPYLEGLGPETLPALEWLECRLGNNPRAPEIRDAIARLRISLDRDLRDWRGWTCRRHRLSERAARE